MQSIWNAVAPTVTTALIALITAAAGWAVAYIRAKAQVQQQAVTGAVAQVDAMTRPAQALDDAGRKAAAMQLVAQRLPTSHMPAPAVLSAMVEAEVGRVHSSAPPAPRVPPPTPKA